MNKDGYTWKTSPIPSVPELYPNMCNNKVTGPIYKLKKEIAKEIEDITQLWYCGVKHREKAHNKGIYKLTDERLNTDILGLPKNSERTNTISKMIKFKQGLIGKNKSVIPKIIEDNSNDWQRPNVVEFFLDFELLTNIF